MLFFLFLALTVLGILIGALCHDIDHPGVTNAFLIASDNDLALLYNDMSVLEHHHAATTFTVRTDTHCAEIESGIEFMLKGSSSQSG